MKHALIFPFSFIVLLSCSTNRYLLIDKGNDKKFLISYIDSLNSKGVLLKRPLIVVDGVPYRFDKELREKRLQLSRSEIAEIEYIEKESEVTIYIYGDCAKDGVILITTTHVKNKTYQTEKEGKVLILQDGKAITLEEMDKIDPMEIDSVNIIKNKELVKKYTLEDYDGVVEIIMKKY